MVAARSHCDFARPSVLSRDHRERLIGLTFFSILLERDRLRAGTKTVTFNSILMKDTEQHVGRPLGVIRIYDMAVPFEIAIQAAQQNDGNLHMGVAMRIAHVAALVNQDVVE